MSDAKGKLVYIIDNEANAGLTAKFLESKGYATIQETRHIQDRSGEKATTSAAIIEDIRDKKPDAIISSGTLSHDPSMQLGRKLIQKFRENDIDMPAILTYASEGSKPRVLPFNTEALIDVSQDRAGRLLEMLSRKTQQTALSK